MNTPSEISTKNKSIVNKRALQRTAAAALAALVMGGTFADAAQARGRDHGWRGQPVAPVQVQRHRGGGDVGAALAVGIIGGLALGALAGSAQPSYAQPAYPYRPVHPVGPVYGGYRPVGGYYGRPVYEPSCRIVTKRYIDEWGDRVVRRREICR